MDGAVLVMRLEERLDKERGQSRAPASSRGKRMAADAAEAAEASEAHRWG